MLKFRELIAAGGFVARGGGVSSFGAVSVSSGVSFNANVRGIVTMNSGTTVVSVSATGVVSGDVIIASPIQYSSVQNSQAVGAMITVAQSVRAGAFEIVTAGSQAPVANMPVGWFRVS